MRVEAQLGRIIRDHPGWVDAVVVGVALLLSVSSMFYIAEVVGIPLTLLLNVPPPLALAVRRRAPQLALAITLGIGLVQWAVGAPINLVQVSTLIAVYSVARYDTRSAARKALAATLVLVALAPLRQPFAGVGNTALAAGLVIVVYLIGTNVGLRKGYLRALEERAERLEHERDAAAETAALLERTRIARELHDVVAHHVSVMVVQAEGAGWAIDARPEQARTAVAAIAQTGRSTLVELRRLLGVLRAGDEDGVAPQPSLDQLTALVEGFRASGLSVVLDLEPVSSPGPSPDAVAELKDLPESLQLAAFRIVQEGLTNVLKHAGPAARASVSVRVREQPGAPAELLVEIRDDGIGAGPQPEVQAGHGLIGIRERVALFDGRAELGADPGGGFRVRALLPVPVRERA